VIDGQVGHAYVAGKDERHAEIAAVADALLQDPDRSDALLIDLIEPLHVVQTARKEAVAAKANATRVDFFAMRTTR
jgi:alpha-D-ribose 1-methylphosphonate 5-triphosphate synthase subunit PhnG